MMARDIFHGTSPWDTGRMRDSLHGVMVDGIYPLVI